MNVSKILFILLRNAIGVGQVCDEIKNLIDFKTLSVLYKLSKAHDLSHLVADSLDKNGLLPEESETGKCFSQQRNMAVYRYEQINYELGEICRVFEEMKIEHIPLKGAVIRNYYPQPWMRTSCDIDILVHEEDLDRAVECLEKQLSYKKERKAYHDISLFSPSGVHLELHFHLKEGMENVDTLLSRAWEYVQPVESCKYQKELKKEYFIFHNVAHASYHFLYGGCGVRTVLDFWILKSKWQYDEKEVEKLCESCGLLKFYQVLIELANAWMTDGERTEIVKQAEEYILQGGVYGSLPNRVAMQQMKAGGKKRYFLYRVFMPYDKLKEAYPVLKKHKWLTPVYQVIRWFKILFKGRVKHSVKELNINSQFSDEEQTKTAELIKNLGL